MMERFNYRNLAEVDKEDIEIFYLLECEQYGNVADREEEMAEREAELERMKDVQ